MKAEKLASVSAAVAVEFEKASFEELREGAVLFLQKHCAGMLNAGEAWLECLITDAGGPCNAPGEGWALLVAVS